MLAAVSNLGVRIAIDDFGTGYSSFTYLKQFPIDTIKIDRAFINGIATDSYDDAIVTAILTLARTLNITTCAEGVETHQQLAALERLDCDYIQGNLVSPAVPARDIPELLEPRPRMLEAPNWSRGSSGC